MFEKEYRDLEFYGQRIENVKEHIAEEKLYEFDLIHREILKIASLIDSVAEHKYGTTVYRLRSARHYQSIKTLENCVEYLDLLLRLATEHLRVKEAEEALKNQEVLESA